MIQSAWVSHCEGNDVHETDIQRMMKLVLKLKMMIRKIMAVMGMRLRVGNTGSW